MNLWGSHTFGHAVNGSIGLTRSYYGNWGWGLRRSLERSLFYWSQWEGFSHPAHLPEEAEPSQEKEWAASSRTGPQHQRAPGAAPSLSRVEPGEGREGDSQSPPWDTPGGQGLDWDIEGRLPPSVWALVDMAEMLSRGSGCRLRGHRGGAQGGGACE